MISSVSLGTNLAASGNFVSFGGGWAMFEVDGTFGGATITLAKKGPGGGNCTVGGSSLTAIGAVNVPLAAGDYKLIVTGGAGVSVTGAITGIPGQS